MRIVNAWDWLDDDGELPVDRPELYAKALRMAQCIEYGGPLEPDHAVLTLIPCRRRPGNRTCRGTLVVAKTPDDLLHAVCVVCRQEELLIANWQGTAWAAGPPAPIPLGDSAPAHRDDVIIDVMPADVRTEVEQVLAAYPIELGELMSRIAAADSPTDVIQALARRCEPENRGQLQTLLDAVMNAWNHTPRKELGGRTPAEMYREPSRVAPRAGRNDPCPCGSGRKYKQCCLH